MQTSKVKQAILSLLAASSLMTGCSDPKAANEANFKKAISKALPSMGLTCVFLSNVTSTVVFPLVVVKGREERFVQPLVNAGLLSAKPGIPKEDYIGGPKYETTEYSLTEEGNKFYKQDAQPPDSIMKTHKLCVGEPEVDKVINFTDPQNAFGVNTSQVKFTFRVKNIPKWAEDPELQAALPTVADIVKAKDTPSEGTITLALTSKGWSDRL